MSECPLRFSIVAKCSVSKARVATMSLPHAVVDTPVFMPVGTQGTMKGVTPEQLKDPMLDCRLILGNTYHLANKPVSFEVRVHVHCICTSAENVLSYHLLVGSVSHQLSTTFRLIAIGRHQYPLTSRRKKYNLQWVKIFK